MSHCASKNNSLENLLKILYGVDFQGGITYNRTNIKKLITVFVRGDVTTAS